MSLSKGIRLSPQAIAAQLAIRKIPSPFGHPSYGKGGRQSNAGITAAVFGSSGFVGRYLMGELGKYYIFREFFLKFNYLILYHF